MISNANISKITCYLLKKHNAVSHFNIHTICTNISHVIATFQSKNSFSVASYHVFLSCSRATLDFNVSNIYKDYRKIIFDITLLTLKNMNVDKAFIFNINNLRHCTLENFKNLFIEGKITSVVLGAFNWSSTLEGFAFWNNTYAMVEKEIIKFLCR